MSLRVYAREVRLCRKPKAVRRVLTTFFERCEDVVLCASLNSSAFLYCLNDCPLLRRLVWQKDVSSWQAQIIVKPCAGGTEMSCEIQLYFWDAIQLLLTGVGMLIVAGVGIFLILKGRHWEHGVFGPTLIMGLFLCAEAWAIIRVMKRIQSELSRLRRPFEYVCEMVSART